MTSRINSRHNDKSYPESEKNFSANLWYNTWRLVEQFVHMSKRENICSLWKKSSEIKWKEIKDIKTAINNTWPRKPLPATRPLKASDCCLDHKDPQWRPLNNTRLRVWRKLVFCVEEATQLYILKIFPIDVQNCYVFMFSFWSICHDFFTFKHTLKYIYSCRGFLHCKIQRVSGDFSINLLNMISGVSCQDFNIFLRTKLL